MSERCPQIALAGPQRCGETIRRFGFEPVSLPPLAGTGRAASAGVCAVAHGWCEAVAAAAPRLAAAVLSTRCDQLRRAAEALRERGSLPVFVLNVPATQGTEAARRLCADEAARLERFLDGLAGVCQPAEEGGLRLSATSQPADAAGAPHRVGLLGCCLTEADNAVLRMAREAGLGVAADLTEDARDGGPSLAQRPNAPFFARLREAGARARLDGWLLIRQPWCDLYHAEAYRLARESGLPVLELETGAKPALEALRTRVEAFAERLEAAKGARA